MEDIKYMDSPGQKNQNQKIKSNLQIPEYPKKSSFNFLI